MARRAFDLRHALLVGLFVATWVLAPESGAADPVVTSTAALPDAKPSATASLVRRTVPMLAAGAALAIASTAFENPGREARGLDTGPWDGASDFGNAWGNGATLAATGGLTWLAGRVAGDEALRTSGGDMLRSLAGTAVVVGAIKVVAHRTRPDGGPYSFPSGHTAAAFAVAPVIAREFGASGGAIAYSFATAAALGRLEDRRHYLSDVIFGAALGIAIGRATAPDRVPSGGLPVVLAPHRIGLAWRF